MTTRQPKFGYFSKMLATSEKLQTHILLSSSDGNHIPIELNNISIYELLDNEDEENVIGKVYITYVSRNTNTKCDDDKILIGRVGKHIGVEPSRTLTTIYKNLVKINPSPHPKVQKILDRLYTLIYESSKEYKDLTEAEDNREYTNEYKELTEAENDVD